MLVPLKIQHLCIWKDSQDSTEHPHINLLFKGKGYHCAAEKRAKASTGGPVTFRHSAPGSWFIQRHALSPDWTTNMCAMNLAFRKAPRRSSHWGLFLPFWSHSPAWLSNQIYQVKTISKQILTGDYQKRFRLYTAHHKSHFPFFGQESRPDVQASPKLPQSSCRVTLYDTVSDNLKCKKKGGKSITIANICKNYSKVY